MENEFTIAIDQTMLVPWYKRLLNLVIDVAIVCIIYVMMGFVAVFLLFMEYPAMYNWFTTMDKLTDRFVATLVFVLYLFIMESITQRSVGKFITGTMVVSENGYKPSPRSFIIRALCRILWLEIFSFLSKTPRGWHDSASATYVVDRKKYMEALTAKNSINEIGSESVYVQ